MKEICEYCEEEKECLIEVDGMEMCDDCALSMEETATYLVQKA